MKYLPANRIFMFFPSGLVVYCNHLVLRDSVQGWRIRAIRYNPSRQTARLVTWQSITVAHSFRFSIEQGGHLFRTPSSSPVPVHLVMSTKIVSHM